MPAPDLAHARSFLFVPASRPDRIAKAADSGADAVIADLEDAVAAEEKESARAALNAALDPGLPVVVRINAVGTPSHAADAALLHRPGVAAAMLPKAEDPAQCAELPVPVLPLVETARGLAAVEGLARAEGVVRLAFGTIDLMLDMDLPEDGAAMAAYRARVALAARVAGIAPPIDGVTTAIDDAARVEEETKRALAFGFTARLCIHPRQVAPVHSALRPTGDETDWAREVVAAAEASDGGAVNVRGQMVDRPVVERARRLLARL